MMDIIFAFGFAGYLLISLFYTFAIMAKQTKSFTKSLVCAILLGWAVFPMLFGQRILFSLKMQATKMQGAKECQNQKKK